MTTNGVSTDSDASPVPAGPVTGPVAGQAPRWGRILAVSLLFNTLIAAVLTLLGRTGTPAENMAYSQCIGLSVAAIVLGGRHLLWPGRPPHPAGMVALAVAGTVAGFLVGHRLGAWVLGMPPDHGRWQAARVPALVTTVLATVAATAFLWMRERMAALRLQAAREQARVEQARADVERARRDAADAQLRMLRAQLEPHMLFNTLANLRALIPLDPPRAQLMLDRLVALLRRTLAASRADRVTLAEEFALLDDWLALVRLRMGERLHATLDLPDALSTLSVPPLLLQPLAENAVRHGLEPKVEGGTLSVRARRQDASLWLEVTDDGEGFDPGRVRDGAFGLAQLRERLRAAFGDAAGMEIDTAPGAGTRIRLHLPVGDDAASLHPGMTTP